MKRSKYYILAIGLLFAFSCTKVDEEILSGGNPADGELVEIPLCFGISDEVYANGETPVTRAPIDGEIDSKIKNAWVFQFNGTGNDSKLLAAPYYIDYVDDQTNSAIAMLVETDFDTRLVFAANLNNDNYNWNMLPGVHSYSHLKNRFITLSGEDPTYGGLAANLIMSAQLDLPSINKNQPINDVVEFYRSVAKIELNIKLSEATKDYKIVSVQLCNVSSRLDIFDNLLDLGDGNGNGVYPEISNLRTIDYPLIERTDENGSLVTYENASSPGTDYVWYVPRNARGISSENSVVESKNLFAFPGSTYFEIIAIDKDGMGVLYKIYPGEDNTSDFNVIPNHLYSMSFTITGNGGTSVTDSRIEQFGDYTFKEDSNCFLINPPRKGMKARTFYIPVTRVNEYWSSPEAGYGATNSPPLNSFGGSSAPQDWTVYLLWQDRSDIVRAKGNGTAEDGYIILEKSTGKGGDEEDSVDKNCYFAITVPADAKEGNFVIGIRRDNDGVNSNILWSWHIWVTGYNPDMKDQVVLGDKWTYNVPGGQVERYAGTQWGYSGTVGDNWDGYTYAHNTPSSDHPYAGSVMMDRHVGALNTSSYQMNDESRRGVLFYQWGRKDPFPSVIDLYDISGSPLSTWNKNTANATPSPTENMVGDVMRASVHNPMTFYTTENDKDKGDWSRLEFEDKLWNDYKIDAANHFLRKSFYDPCPQGWKLPINGVWADFRMGKEDGRYTMNSNVRGLDWNQGAYYWPYIEGAAGTGYPKGGDIYYPAVGNRNFNGNMQNEGSAFRVTNASASGKTYMFSFQANDNLIDPKQAYGAKSLGTAVRCVRYDRPIE